MTDPAILIDLALRAGAEAADVMVTESDETPIGFEANRLKTIESRNSRAIGLRVIRDGRLGVAAATDMDNPGFIVDSALDVAAFGARAAFTLPPPVHPHPMDLVDASLDQLPLDAMVQAGQRMIDGVRAVNPDVLCEASVVKARTRTRIASSTGLDVSWDRTTYATSVSGTLIRGTDMLYVGEGEASCRFFDKVDWIVSETRTQLERAARNAPIPSGTMPVLFTHSGVAYALAGPILSALNGRTVLQGASPLAGRLGDTITDPRISLTDDPLAPWQPGSAPVDDEGLPTARQVLIGDGVLQGFYYDLQTAGLAGVPPTANGARSPGSLASPAIHALCVGNGSTPVEDLIRDMESGLIVELVIGAGQGNVLGGDFGGNVVLGYRVERGEITGRVKDTMIAGNVWECLRRVRAVASDGRWVGGSFYTPSLLVDGVTVASRDQGARP